MERSLRIACCVLVLWPGNAALAAEETPAAPAAVAEAAAEEPIPADQLDSLVAPIALYPDPLLAQTLVAATYPLELVQLQQWLAKNPELKDKALTDALVKQPWDPAIQSMAAFPEVVKRLTDDIQWTTDLGNAFLAQQGDVMDAVQRMRKKAKDKGALESNEQQKVATETVEDKTVIVIESANPEVIYVPSYSPTVVYGAPIYPYPPIYYPPYPPGAAFVSFSFGVMWGAAIWGGSCCGCGWGGNDIDINVDNNFNRNTNIDRGDRTNISGGDGKWKHDASHRGGTPYANKSTADRFGGTARGDSLASRQNRATPSTGNRAGGAGSGARPSTGQSRPSSPAARPSTGQSRSSSPAARPSTGSSERMGSRSLPSSSGSRSSGFGGGSSGFSGSSARASSSRGASSMGSRSFGGGGGGGRGGGRR